MTFEDFRNDVFEAINDKPNHWRDGQTVFNFIDEVYGVARHVQFYDHIDCFHDDEQIEAFIVAAYNQIKTLEFE